MTILGKYRFEWNHAFTREAKPLETTQIFDRSNRRVGVGRVSLDTKNTARDLGRKESMKQALKNAKIEKRERTKIWEDYRTKMTKQPRW